MGKNDFLDTGINYLEDFDFNFEEKTLVPSKDNDKLFFIIVYADWCGHCQHATPEFAKLVKMIDQNRVVLCCVDGTGKGTRESEQNLTKRLKDCFSDFRGFPHIAMFKNGKFLKNHEGGRKVEDFMKSIKNNS